MKEEKEDIVVNSYIEWGELNALYGRVLTILEALGTLPETYTVDNQPVTGQEKREAIKSLFSDAIFSHDYKGFGARKSDMKLIEGFDYYHKDQ